MRAEEVVQNHGDKVYRIIRRTIYDREVHPDLFQEVFLRIIESLPSFKKKSKLSTWVHSVAIHTCYDHIRSLTRHRHVSFEEWMEGAGNDMPSETTPYESASTTGQARILEGAMSQLPPKYRLPIHLFYMEGLAYKEIAEALNMPVGTVKTNLFRGLRQLREIIGGDLNEML